MGGAGQMMYLYPLVVLAALFPGCTASGEVIFAVNAGGEAHTDVYGIHYDKDPLDGIIGTASDYGRTLTIRRVHDKDQILYQTERYNDDSFGYDITIEQDGDYVLVLKFSEVYFSSANSKVFDILLNEQHKVVSQLDIYERVGQGAAHDEYVPFTVTKGKLKVVGEVSTFEGILSVEFIKGYRDNPKICALYVMEGNLDDVPQLPPIQGLELEEEEEEESLSKEEEILKEIEKKKPRRTSGPRVEDPYSSDDSSFIIPIAITVGVFIPVLFFLCRV